MGSYRIRYVLIERWDEAEIRHHHAMAMEAQSAEDAREAARMLQPGAEILGVELAGLTAYGSGQGISGDQDR